jgi:hypothetical protein
MTTRHLTVLSLIALVAAGCANHADIEAVGRYGGYTTPTYAGPLAECPPVAAVDFSTLRQTLSDDDFEAVFPALQRLNPRRISLGGQPVSDRVVDLLNQLPYLQAVNLEGTRVTPQGFGRLKLARWE